MPLLYVVPPGCEVSCVQADELKAEDRIDANTKQERPTIQLLDNRLNHGFKPHLC